MKQILFALILSGAVFAQSKSDAPKAAPAAKSAPAADLLNPSTLKAKAPEDFGVRLNTSKGDVVLAIHRSWAPVGADRFYNLVRGGYFTNVAFFRVVRAPRPFMAQFGISPRPEVNKAWMSAKMLDDMPRHSNTRGTLTFAVTGAPNSRGTQLFINFADNAFLDSQGFAPIGEVVQGMENMDKLYSGYGENGPDQGRFTNEGRAYTDKAFPMLDHILTATIVPVPGAAPADAKDAKK